MTTKEVADQLVKMCRDGKVEEVKQELFTEDTFSIEPKEGILPKETKGIQAIQKKAKLFISMVEQFYGSTITDPVVAGNYFSVGWGYGYTNERTGTENNERNLLIQSKRWQDSFRAIFLLARACYKILSPIFIILSYTRHKEPTCYHYPRANFL